MNTSPFRKGLSLTFQNLLLFFNPSKFFIGGSKMCFLLFFVLSHLAFSSLAQTPQQQLEQAILTYTALRSYSEPLSFEALNASQEARIQSDIDKGIALTEALVRSQSGNLAALARYFRTQFRLESIRLLVGQARYESARDLVEAIRPDIESLVEMFFPRIYQLEGKEYTIRWPDFAPERAQYYRLAAEIYWELKDFPKAKEEALRVSGHPFVVAADQVAAYFVLVEVKGVLKENNESRVEAAIEGLRLFDRLSPTQQEQFVNSKRNFLKTMYLVIDETIRNAGLSLDNPGQPYGEAAPIIASYESVRDEAIGAYREAIRLNFGYRGFAQRAYDFAVLTLEDPSTKNNPARTAMAKKLALEAVNQISNFVSVDDCEELNQLEKRYSFLKQDSLADLYRKRFRNCKVLRDERLNQKNPEFHVSISTYVIPLFTFNRNYRDFGLAFNFGGRRVIWELSYQWIRQNKERFTDQSLGGNSDAPDVYWSGYYAHLGLKFAGKSQNRRTNKRYQGFILSYNERNINEIESLVITPTGNISDRFTPQVKQYGLLYNTGVWGAAGLYAEVYFSAGLAYNTFDIGNDRYEGMDVSFSNQLLNDRSKNYITPIGRIGILFGIGK